MAKIGVVIVNYNGAKYQNDCIKSLYNMTYKDFEIIVVDSCSTDNSLDMLEKDYPNVHILRQSTNVGVAAGNNIGIRYSKSIGTEFTLLLNNDTELHEDMLSELLKKADKRTVTVPKIYYYDNKKLLWFAGGKLDWSKASAFHEGIKEEDHGLYDKERIITYAPTCCMLIHNSIFEQVGFIDETVFMYFDDTDFCVRLGDNNIKILYVPSAFMWHKVSSASGGIESKIGVYYNNRNQLYYMKKYKDRVKKTVKFKIIFKNLVKAVLSPIRKKNEKYIFIAYKDFFIGNMGCKNF